LAFVFVNVSRCVSGTDGGGEEEEKAAAARPNGWGAACSSLTHACISFHTSAVREGYLDGEEEEKEERGRLGK